MKGSEFDRAGTTSLPEKLKVVLHEIEANGQVQHPDGHYLDVKANISKDNGNALVRYIRERRPELVIEIGMAYGVSTINILGALEANGHGRLISIDPYIGWPTGRLVALHQINRAGVAHRHEHIHACSYSALPKLLAEGVKANLVYIDGNHNFDYAFTDFFFSDKLLATGSVVAFNDAGWRAVYKVIRFLHKYRKYKELDIGLQKVFRSRNMLFSLIKKIEGRSTNDRYFEKLEEWEPKNGFYCTF